MAQFDLIALNWYQIDTRVALRWRWGVRPAARRCWPPPVLPLTALLLAFKWRPRPIASVLRPALMFRSHLWFVIRSQPVGSQILPGLVTDSLLIETRSIRLSCCCCCFHLTRGSSQSNHRNGEDWPAESSRNSIINPSYFNCRERMKTRGKDKNKTATNYSFMTSSKSHGPMNRWMTTTTMTTTTTTEVYPPSNWRINKPSTERFIRHYSYNAPFLALLSLVFSSLLFPLSNWVFIFRVLRYRVTRVSQVGIQLGATNAEKIKIRYISASTWWTSSAASVTVRGNMHRASSASSVLAELNSLEIHGFGILAAVRTEAFTSSTKFIYHISGFCRRGRLESIRFEAFQQVDPSRFASTCTDRTSSIRHGILIFNTSHL